LDLLEKRKVGKRKQKTKITRTAVASPSDFIFIIKRLFTKKMILGKQIVL